jgi:LPPG:FO 2-phospho-L-lactate transferase
MTDDPVATRLSVEGEWIEFQEYFVHRGHRDPVAGIRYDGLEAARASTQVVESLRKAEAVVIVNSNPALSILPILELSPVRELLTASTAPRVAVSPIVGSDSVAGPAGDLMGSVGFEASARGVAAIYSGLIDGLVIDRQDEAQAAAIEAAGVHVLCTDTIMRTLEDRERLAREALDFAGGLR